MIFWGLFAVAAFPIVCLSLKGLFVVATEGDKLPLPHTRGGVILGDGMDLEGDDVKPWNVDLGEFLNDVDLGESMNYVEEADPRDTGILVDDPNEDH